MGEAGTSTSGPAPAPVAAAARVRVAEAAEWDEILSRLRGLDSYTRLAYHRVSALLESPGAQPVLLHHVHPDGETALPLLLRPLPDGSGWDASSAYGYGGPVARPGHGVPAFGTALNEWAHENAVVATFLRLHPLLRNAELVPSDGSIVRLGATVAWDVAPGRDLLAAMHPHHRRAARKAERAGLEVTVVPRPRRLDGFRHLYDVTMRRQQADPFFFFGDAYWDALLSHAEALGLVLVEGRLEGDLVTGLLCLSEGPWLHYHLGASAEAARTIGASNRCFLAAAQWAQSLGMSRFHLGGGVGGNSESQLFVFKHRFDPAAAPLPFHVAKLVHDRERYRRLAGTESTAGFFPPWRRDR